MTLIPILNKDANIGDVINNDIIIPLHKIEIHIVQHASTNIQINPIVLEI